MDGSPSAFGDFLHQFDLRWGPLTRLDALNPQRPHPFALFNQGHGDVGADVLALQCLAFFCAENRVGCGVDRDLQLPGTVAVHCTLAKIIRVKAPSHRRQSVGIGVRNADVSAPHFAVMNVIDAEMRAEQIGGDRLNFLRVGKRPQPIAELQQKRVMALAPLAVRDLIEHDADLPARPVFDSERVDGPPAPERRRLLFEAGRLSCERDASVNLAPVLVLVRCNLPHRTAHAALDADHSRERRTDLNEAVIGRAIVWTKCNINRAETLLDGIENREVAVSNGSAFLR